MRQRCTQLLSKGDFKQSLNQPSWYPSITTQDSITLLFIYRLFPRYLMGLVSTRQEELINTNTVSLHCTFQVKGNTSVSSTLLQWRARPMTDPRAGHPMGQTDLPDAILKQWHNTWKKTVAWGWAEQMQIYTQGMRIMTRHQQTC